MNDTRRVSIAKTGWCWLLAWFACVACSSAQRPPVAEGVLRKPDLVEVRHIEPGLKLDIRYASTNNFLGRPVYRQARAFLQRPAAEALARAHRALAAEGYGILVYDGYRPWRVTKEFWDTCRPKQRPFVADPAKGSRHNRGCAVDCTLFELKSGREVPMPSGYDEPTDRSHPGYTGGNPEARRLRDLLRDRMEREGFTVLENEWWHFDYQDWKAYPILDIPFERLSLR